MEKVNVCIFFLLRSSCVAGPHRLHEVDSALGQTGLVQFFSRARPILATSVIPVFQTTLGFILDRDCIVQGANDRDFDVGVHCAKPLQVHGLNLTFSGFY